MDCVKYFPTAMVKNLNETTLARIFQFLALQPRAVTIRPHIMESCYQEMMVTATLNELSVWL